MRLLSTRTMQIRVLSTSTIAENGDKYNNNSREVAKDKNNAN